MIEPKGTTGGLDFTTIFFRASEAKVVTTNQTSDHKEAVDERTLPQVGRLVCLLKREKIKKLKAAGKTRAEALNAPFLDFKHREVVAAWQRAEEALGIKDMTRSVYPLKHGGASRDALSRRRSLEIRRRVNLAVMTSVQNCKRSGRLSMLTYQLGRYNYLQGRKFLQSGESELKQALSRG